MNATVSCYQKLRLRSVQALVCARDLRFGSRKYPTGEGDAPASLNACGIAYDTRLFDRQNVEG